MSKVIFRSPGVYTKEVHVSGSYIPRKQIRKGKINRIFGVKNTENIYRIYHESNEGYILADNYDDLKNKFGGT